MDWRAISLSVTIPSALSSYAELAAEFSDRNGLNAVADPRSADDAASRELNVVAAPVRTANVTIPANSSFRRLDRQRNTANSRSISPRLPSAVRRTIDEGFQLTTDLTRSNLEFRREIFVKQHEKRGLWGRMSSRGQSNILCCVIGMFLAACAVPVQETKVFDNSVREVAKASDPLFDQLSAAERKQRLIKLSRAPIQVAGSFDPSDAYYYASIGDGPGATELRLSFAVVEAYAQLLVSLVDGSTTNQQQGQLQVLATNIAALTKFAEASTLGIPLSPILNQLLTAQNAAEAKQLVIDGAPAMIDLLERLKTASKPIFETLVFEDRPLVGTKSAADRNADIIAQRTKVANFVVLIDRLETSFKALLLAYQHPSNSVALAAIASASGDLASDAVAVRKAYSTLGSK